MEDRKANIISVISVIALIILVISARVLLKLSRAFFLICGASIAAILAVFSCVFIRHRYNRRRKLLESQLRTEGRELRIEHIFLRKVAGVPTKYRFKELEEATDGFQALLGKGSSASVFKGILNDVTSVAVKRIDGEERGEKEFRSEVASIASVHHVNLVPIDVARELSYLRHDCRRRVLHLDVKPENILLDENYKALVSDFDLSTLAGKDVSQLWDGSIGDSWREEECVEGGGSEGQDQEKVGLFLPKIVNVKVREGKFMEIVERGGVEESEVTRLVYIALWCIQEKPRLRPSMAQVVDMPEGRVRVNEPPGSRMILVDLLAVDEDPADHKNLQGC
ncbi:putative receptor-like protein kinase [Glycine max]|nr:putative receptor-like protein kinase [Glycine max]